MNARDVWILYLHEIRSALRERTVVVYSLLIPAVLYPALLWLAWTGAMFVAGQTSSEARVAVVGLPAEHAAFVRSLEAEKPIQVVPLPRAEGGASASDEAIRKGEADAIVEWSHATVTVVFDGAKPRSEEAASRAEAAFRAYREAWLTDEAARRGVPRGDWEEARFSSRSVATGRDMGAFLLKLVIPMVLLVMISIGCFYPAIDATAGERERSTWETLMTVGASRESVVLAKYLYVSTFGATAGLLNLAAMLVSLRAIVASVIPGAPGKSAFEVPLSAIPLTMVCAALMALFIAAAMMILASMARTFKEGQAMITPFYLTLVIPTILLQSPDAGLSPTVALIPLVNVALTFREAISGTFRWPLIALTAVTQVAAIAACVFVASKLTRYEEMIAGPGEGGIRALVRTWLGRRRTAPKEGAR